MANRKDYTEIKKRKNYLPEFMVNWGRLPEYLAETNQQVQTLETNSVILGKLTVQQASLTSGSLLEGQIYVVTELQAGDDFSNVGFVGTNIPFKATGTTPLNWSFGSILTTSFYNSSVIYNDVDVNLNFDTVIGEESTYFLKIIITNNKFTDLKIFVTNVTFTILNSNEILIPLSDVRYKIEIYN